MSNVATKVDVVVNAGAVCGEGPVWDAPRDRVLWVDIDQGRLHSTDTSTGHDSWVEFGRPISALAPRAKGGFVLAMKEGFAIADAHLGSLQLIAPISEGERFRLNDGKCDPAGRFLAGSVGPQDAPMRGTLYSLTGNSNLLPVLGDLAVANGMAWSSDGRTMYFIDTMAGGVDAFDYDLDTGALSRRRRIIEIADAFADGMTIDTEGLLWIALWGGGAVRRYRPSGELVQEIRFPASLVTCPAFGGRDLDVLYVTSATRGLDGHALAAEPLAGALFACRPGATGFLPHTFAG